MDIKKKIEELKAERAKQMAHDRAVAINKQIGKLDRTQRKETVLKNAGEILFEDATEKDEAVHGEA